MSNEDETSAAEAGEPRRPVIKDRENARVSKAYPIKRRIISASMTLAVLLVATITWHYEPAKVIAISAFTVARLFDLKGKWCLLFLGIGIGDMLLYLVLSLSATYR